jgi:hypothetical protein
MRWILLSSITPQSKTFSALKSSVPRTGSIHSRNQGSARTNVRPSLALKDSGGGDSEKNNVPGDSEKKNVRRSLNPEEFHYQKRVSRGTVGDHFGSLSRPKWVVQGESRLGPRMGDVNSK